MPTPQRATADVLPVSKSKEQARSFYDSISGFYDLLTGPLERRCAKRGPEMLSLQPGEHVLEIGFGTGYCFRRIVKSVGPTGRAYGIDISRGMVEVTKGRLRKASTKGWWELCCADGQGLPFRARVFDAAFMSFTLELFDTPDIPRALAEVQMVPTNT